MVGCLLLKLHNGHSDLVVNDLLDFSVKEHFIQQLEDNCNQALLTEPSGPGRNRYGSRAKTVELLDSLLEGTEGFPAPWVAGRLCNIVIPENLPKIRF